MFVVKLLFVLIALASTLASTTYGNVLMEQTLPLGYPTFHKISNDNGVFQCGEVTCPKGSYHCSIETESENPDKEGLRKKLVTLTKCSNAESKDLKKRVTSMRSPKPDMILSIRTSSSIDGVKGNSMTAEQGSLRPIRTTT